MELQVISETALYFMNFENYKLPQSGFLMEVGTEKGPCNEVGDLVKRHATKHNLSITPVITDNSE